MVKPVIIRAVHLGVVAWGQSGHLVPVDGVVPDQKVELLFLLGLSFVSFEVPTF